MAEITKNKIARNTLALFAGTAVGHLFSFLLMVIIARTLGDVGVGQYSFLFAFGYVITILANPGLEYLIIKDVPADKALASPYCSNIMAMKTLLAILSGAAAIFLLKVANDNRLIFNGFLIVVVIYMINSAMSVFPNILRANERMDLTALIDAIERLVAFLVGVTLLYFTQSLLYLVLALLVSNVVRQVLYFLFSKKYFAPRVGIDFLLWKQMFVRSLPFALSGSLLYIYHRVDTVMLSLMIDDKTTGWYNAAYRLIDVIHYIPMLLVTVILPSMALYSKKDKPALSAIFNRALRYLVILAFPIGVGIFLLAPKLIFFVFGEGFENAVTALRVLVWAEVFAFLNYLGGQLLNMTGYQKRYTFIVSATVGFNIILNLILIPRYHHIGAGLATLLSELLIFFMVYTCIEKNILGLRLWSLVWKPLFVSIIMGVLVIKIQFLPIGCIVMAGSIFYFTALYILGELNSQDKEVLHSVLDVVGLKRHR